ncbi:hypothetical protein [Shewanella baltica]|uniref:hypothetical protein n=1 Tax=Shewanella baltica TaxID=62322 RepID=UPI00217DCF34|nr:hypothetical protein [Shewanella baltica]MCS6192134.1 hypothetical protein [Shewanella baltica]
MEEKTYLEKICGNMGTVMATTLVAASSGIFLAPLLPVLTASIASSRAEKRVENALEDLNIRLSMYEEQILSMSDNQYKLIGEIVSSIMQCTSEPKIELLKNAAVGCLHETQVEDHEASVLSRILRDITVLEYKFLITLSKCSEIVVRSSPLKNFKLREGMVEFQPKSLEANLLNNLERLNLLHTVISGFGVDIYFEFSPVTHKLLALCGESNVYQTP